MPVAEGYRLMMKSLLTCLLEMSMATENHQHPVDHHVLTHGRYRDNG